jgi:hypothetical protein
LRRDDSFWLLPGAVVRPRVSASTAANLWIEVLRAIASFDVDDPKSGRCRRPSRLGAERSFARRRQRHLRRGRIFRFCNPLERRIAETTPKQGQHQRSNKGHGTHPDSPRKKRIYACLDEMRRIRRIGRQSLNLVSRILAALLMHGRLNRWEDKFISQLVSGERDTTIACKIMK